MESTKTKFGRFLFIDWDNFLIHHTHKWWTRVKQWDQVHASEAYEAKKTKENNVTMPHKPRLHALGPTVFCVSAIYEYGVFISEI